MKMDASPVSMCEVENPSMYAIMRPAMSRETPMITS
jgi:hypothetical protein